MFHVLLSTELGKLFYFANRTHSSSGNAGNIFLHSLPPAGKDFQI